MKRMLLAVNAKYIHSNLAVYSLKAYAEKHGYSVCMREFTINQREDEILRELYREAPDVLAVSVYIWNVTLVRELLWDISRILPGTELWLGGPEVSFCSGDILEELPFLSGIMRGEGEETFACLCRFWEGREGRGDFRGLEAVPGITWRDGEGMVRSNPDREPLDLDELPFPYQGTEDLKNRIIYYESSRGCPFSCSYCLSSVEKKMRFRSLERVFEEIQFFLDRKVPQVKFVDRTFNCRRWHTLAVWEFLLEHDNGITNFHFEIGADLLDEEEIGLLARMRPGLVQLEIGVQSVNPKTLGEIRRTMDFQKLCRNVRAVQAGRNVHQHLDLIAGLPWEDYESFRESFNQVYSLAPQQLQLGFLKVLRGSAMYDRAAEYGCIYKKKEPYEVLSTRWLSYEKVLKLKLVEEMVEVYYNSGQFSATLRKAEALFPEPFDMYEALGEFYERKGYLQGAHTRIRRYEILLEFFAELGEAEQAYEAVMLYDLYSRENLKSRPSWAPDQTLYKEAVRRFFRQEAAGGCLLNYHGTYDWKQLRSMTHVEIFERGLPEIGQNRRCVLLFDYSRRDPLDGSARRIDITQEVNANDKENQRNTGSAG